MTDDRGWTERSGQSGAGGTGRRRRGQAGNGQTSGDRSGMPDARGDGSSAAGRRGQGRRSAGSGEARRDLPRYGQQRYDQPRYGEPPQDLPHYDQRGHGAPRGSSPRRGTEPSGGRADEGHDGGGRNDGRSPGRSGPRPGYREVGRAERTGAPGRTSSAHGSGAGGRAGTRAAARQAAAPEGTGAETSDSVGGARAGEGHGAVRGARGTARDRRRQRRRRVIKWTAISTASVLVLAIAFGGYWWYRLNHNLSVAALHGTAPIKGVVAEKADPFGRKPINILLIGSDGRDNAADCKIGGDCDLGASGSNADVEMLLHVAADRSNATVVSIPRDTEVPIPQCTDAKGEVHAPQRIAMINSALQVSPSCQVDTVEELTHVQIDHFIEVDFQGVVNITDAVGGVPVCVTAPVHDPGSHLNLPAGTSIVKGMTALEFLRSRHGFGDGSDLYRTQVQHQYMSSLVRQLRKEGNLSDTGTLLHIADVATKSLTVDQGLDGLTKLMNLADDLEKVPTNRITFMTMPTEPYPADTAHVQPEQPEDNEIFSMINQDVSASKGATKATPSPAPTIQPAAPASVGTVVVANGTATGGRAAEVAYTLDQAGFARTDAVNYADATETQTVVRYEAGQQPAALAVAKALKVPASQVEVGATSGGDVEVVIGSDFTAGTTYSAPTSSGGALSTSLASQAASENAANSSVCAKANPDD